jgi:hypothetical protein
MGFKFDLTMVICRQITAKLPYCQGKGICLEAGILYDLK